MNHSEKLKNMTIFMTAVIKKIAAVGIFLFFAMGSAAYSQTMLYTETFLYSNGTTQGSGFPAKWILSGNPMFWDHFEVRNNRMEANKISIEGSWISQTIDITGFTGITLTSDIESAGALSASSDYIRGFYKINGGSEVQWFNVSGNASPVTKTITVPNGGTLQIVLRVRNDNGETYFFDNVSVTGLCATNAGTASVSNTVINSGQTVSLNLTGHSGAIQWQQSNDNINFTDIAGGTVTPFTTAQLTGPNTYYFRAKVTGGCSNFSNTVSVVVNQASNNFTTDSLHINRVATIGSSTLVLENDPGGAENSIYTTNNNGGGLLLQSRTAFPFNTLINANNEANVGIGTLNPQKKLHIRTGHTQTGEGSHQGIRLENHVTPLSGPDNVSIWDIEPIAGDAQINSPSTFRIGTPGTPILTLSSNGNAGLGTTNPLQKLHIAGNGFFTGTLSIGDNYVPSGFKFSVNGKIIAEDVTVALRGTWPDYVFSKSYKLMSIAELEQWIKEKSSLPRMPTAKQVKDNGISTGEIIVVHTEKIEELTLYIILLNNRMQKLEQENVILKQLIIAK